MDKNLQRAMYGPSVAEVIVGVILSLVIGVGLAAVWLVIKPVTTLKEPSNEMVPNMVYYIPGESNNTTSRTWMRKRQILAEAQPGEVQVVEAELNAWAVATLKPPPATDTSTLVPGQLNFRIRDGLFQIASPCTLNVLGTSRPVIFQMRGDFRKHGDTFAFHPEEMFLGSLALHRLPGVLEAFTKKLSEVQALPEDIANGWKKLTNVSVNADTLHLTFP